MTTPADWQLPPGVNRGLWDYVHDSNIAAGYDAGLAGSSLFHLDLAFVDRHCRTPGRLLDLGCGTGRLLVHLARKGWWALGVDLSAHMLGAARQSARQAGVNVQLLQANIAELDFLAAESFSRAACLFSTLGMVNGDAVRRRVLAGVYRLLEPGGRFLLHVHNRWFHLWDAPGRRWLLADEFKRWRGDPSVGDHVMPVHQDIAGLTLHLFSRAEAVRLLEEAGFKVTDVEPISLRPDGRVVCPGWFAGLRAYGFLLAAEKPARSAATNVGRQRTCE